MKIRLHGTEDECREVAGRLAAIVDVLAVSEPYADRGASRLVRVYVEARLDPPSLHLASTTGRTRQADERASGLAQRMTGGRRRGALPPGSYVG